MSSIATSDDPPRAESLPRRPSFESRAHLAFAILLAYFAAAIVAAAIDHGCTIGWRELALLGEVEQRELALAWRLSRGELGHERGPLFSLLLWLGSMGAPADVARVVLARHLIFPLASLAVVAWIARAQVPSSWLRVGVLAGGGLLALHLATETLAPSMGLAACFVLSGGAADPRRLELRRGASAGLTWMIAVLLEPSWIAPAFASVVVLGLASTAALGARAWIRAGGASAVLVAGGLGLILAGWRRALLGIEVERAAEGVGLALLILQALALVLVVRTEDRRSREAPLLSAAWIGTLPIAAVGLLRGDADSLQLAGLAPSIVLLVLVARCARAAPLASVVGALSVAIVVLASAPRYDRRTAWRPGVFVDVIDVSRGRRGPERAEGDLHAASSWMASVRGCTIVTGDLVAAQLVARAPGPIDGDAPDDLEEARCPHAVESIRSFDRPYRMAALAFGPDLRARAERYAIATRLGPATFAAHAREPVRATERAVALDVSTPPGGSLALAFDRPIAAEHVLVVRVRTDARRVIAQVLSGTRPIREPMELTVQGGALWIPIEAERAEWRWIAGRSARDPLSADGLRLVPEPRGSIVVEGAIELSPPQAPAITPRRCAPTVDRLGTRGYARHSPAPVQDGRVLLDPNPPGHPAAELFAPITPCSGACLVGEVGLEGDASEGFAFEVHAVDGPERWPLLDWWIAPGWRRPFEIPLERWAGRDVLLRFATSPGETAEGDRARIHRPRVRPCASLVSLVHALHDGRHRVVRGDPSIVGDTLSLPLAPAGEPPVEVRLPITVPERACLALDVAAADRDGPVAVVAGVVAGGRVYRLAREVIDAADSSALRSHADLSLSPWEGQAIELYFAGWPLERGRTGRAQIVRPRVHRCGERADWAF